MGRLTNKLWEIKPTKIRNLEQELQQRKGIIDRNSDSNQDKVKHWEWKDLRNEREGK